MATVTTTLERYFKPYRERIVGRDLYIETPYGAQRAIYADWTASGRLYHDIERKLLEGMGPYVANTHTKTATLGATMTEAYIAARRLIKNHVNANDGDVLINVGTGMTGAINKFQRIMGLKVCERLKEYTVIPEEARPVVFISHMEHHSNHTTWLETICQVVVVPHNEQGLLCLASLEKLLTSYPGRQLIVAVSACSNVTGIQLPVHRIAKMAHAHGAICIADYACSAPYVEIDMHPDGEGYLDAVVFSPHKFLGGPGASGVLVFNKALYKNLVPDNPGGGTVLYTNPWGDHDYIDDIETREDGGTPGFLQTIKTALAIQLKEEMGVDKILEREHELNAIVFKRLAQIPNLHLLAAEHTDRLGVFSFFLEHVHYDLVVSLLNDRFGIQTRGGCSCAGTYGHYLLNVDKNTSKAIEQHILEGCLVDRPGWVRMSLHPTMTNKEVTYICDAVEAVAKNHEAWGKDDTYNAAINAFSWKGKADSPGKLVDRWFGQLPVSP